MWYEWNTWKFKSKCRQEHGIVYIKSLGCAEVSPYTGCESSRIVMSHCEQWVTSLILESPITPVNHPWEPRATTMTCESPLWAVSYHCDFWAMSLWYVSHHYDLWVATVSRKSPCDMWTTVLICEPQLCSVSRHCDMWVTTVICESPLWAVSHHRGPWAKTVIYERPLWSVSNHCGVWVTNISRYTSLTHPLTLSPTNPLTHSPSHPLTYSPTHLHTPPLTRSLANQGKTEIDVPLSRGDTEK